MVEDVVRQTILADPAVVLEDRDMIRALIGAESDMGRNVVDLRGVLIDRLEGKLDRLEDTHRDVVAAAYENLAGTHQIHRAVLAAFTPKTFDGFLRAIDEDLSGIMALDAVKLCVEGDGVRAGQALGPEGPLRRTILGLPKGGVAAYCGQDREVDGPNVVLRRATRAGSLIFGDNARAIQSEAILKLDLGEGRLPGLLAFGSLDPNRFHAEQGTDLLTFLGAAFGLALQRWLD